MNEKFAKTTKKCSQGTPRYNVIKSLAWSQKNSTVTTGNSADEMRLTFEDVSMAMISFDGCLIP